MRKFIVVIFIIFISCNNKNNNHLELEILNKNIVSLQNRDNFKYLFENMKDSNVVNKSKTVIVYKLTNYSDLTYYFNMNFNSKFESKINGIPLKVGDLCVYENEKNEVVKINTYRINRIFNENDCINKNFKISRFLDYSMDFYSPYIQEQSNFIIHPNETLYFEWFVNLPYGNEFQNAYLKLDKSKKYYARMIMFSDSVNYKKSLSRTTLKTIKENKYEIYHGIIESKNKVPIKILE